MSNGKGSRPRNNMSEAFRANYEAINWNKKVISAFPKPQTTENTLKKHKVRLYSDESDFFALASNWQEKSVSMRVVSVKPSKRAKSQGNGLKKAIVKP